MMRAEPHTLKGAMQVAIRTLGVARCAEICGIAEASVYRYANPNEPHLVPAHYALVLDQECWRRFEIAPFRELFEANAGEPVSNRLARRIRELAEQIEQMPGAAA